MGTGVGERQQALGWQGPMPAGTDEQSGTRAQKRHRQPQPPWDGCSCCIPHPARRPQREDRMLFSELKPSDQCLGTCQKTGKPAASRWHRGGSLWTGGLGLLERPLWCSSPAALPEAPVKAPGPTHSPRYNCCYPKEAGRPPTSPLILHV